MLGALYNGDILSLSSTLRNEALDAPDGTARKLSKLCGSWVEVDVAMEGGFVSDAALRVQACALGQASAAVLKANILGADLTMLKTARDGLQAMLKEAGEPPQGRFSQLKLLQSVRDYPARHQSTMLAFEAAVEAVEKAGAKEA
ncbi:iron-sulfur cluster assembly scaffold protein [uncultured Algimonas sp.]|uniref:iron-sulfur cluster assembly scaffold protein n=1 Tax=uncultured Algimonas sp. TaxID=1547920 RepID=UPI00344C12BB